MFQPFYYKVQSMNTLAHSLRILIVVKSHNPQASQLATSMCAWLQEQGHTLFTPSDADDVVNYCDKNLDLIIVLGGDGTMLGVARKFITRPVPLVGINFGRVGFLAELTSANWQEGLSAIVRGNYNLVKRMALGWRLYRQGNIFCEGHAINDVVITRGALSRVVSLDVSVDTEHITHLRADGIIISSPVGSTGYAVSAGGPLVHPANNNILITAICPYLCNFPAMVLPHTLSVQVTLNQSTTKTFASIDGQENFPLEVGDKIEVFCVPEAVYFTRLEQDRYFTPLRERGFIHGLQ